MYIELTTRVEALESQLRRWKIITIVVLVAMTVLVGAAAAPPQDNGFIQQFAAPKFAAQIFLLVGKDGKTYARLSIRREQPILEFYDSKGAVIWSAPSSNGGFKPVQAQ
ncbi:MAG: hypothetical protein ACRD3P_19050 [Terriglobales bacterium]